MPSPSRSLLVLYMPVLHRGYLELIEAHPDINEVAVLDSDLLSRIDYIRKDLRALSPQQQAHALKGIKQFESVAVINKAGLADLDHPDIHIIMPDEDISREIASLLTKPNISYYPIFLRWDRQSVTETAAHPDETVTELEFEQHIMAKAYEASRRSSDIWRHVGAVLLDKDNQLINQTSNEGEPSEHTSWMEGDPRNLFKQGQAVEASLFTHAEAKLIAEAARDGQSLQGGSIYVTTFPCPPCAKLIAHSGLKTCYYASGYSILDGRRVLDEYGVNTVKVLGIEPHDDKRRLVSYS